MRARSLLERARDGHEQASRSWRTHLPVCLPDSPVLPKTLNGTGVVRQIAWQLADAGTSIAANYEEAKGSYSRREFAAKNAIVLKEAREARLWLRVILACGLAAEADARPLYDEANELVVIFIAS